MRIQFESSTACNAGCSFCPRIDMTRTMGMMSDELFRKIIKEGKEMGAKYYLPFLNGEPFLFPKIYDWIGYMEKEGVRVVLYTNAELIDVDRLLKYSNIRYINCSLNAATEETHKKIMRFPNFERVNKNVEDLIKNAYFSVTVSMAVSAENAHEEEMFRNKWGKRASVSRVFSWPSWSGNKGRALERGIRKIPCDHMLKNVIILWDGRVSLCCLDYDGKVILGNLNNESLKDIIVNKLDPIRRRHLALDFDMPLCKSCNKNEVFG